MSLFADGVVVLHAAFLAFTTVGGVLAWRWPALLWVHVPAVAWGVGIVVIGYDCPLTWLEEWLRDRAGEAVDGGFIDRYIEGVVYPERFTPLLRALVAACVATGWLGAWQRHVRPSGRSSTPRAA